MIKDYSTFYQHCLESSRQKMGDISYALHQLRQRRTLHKVTVKEIPFNELSCWSFTSSNNWLSHESGKFFSIAGIDIKTNFGGTPSWQQPIIYQPEIGILGIIAKEINGVVHFLLQMKMEPGNIGTYQLSPTVQATKSNYTQVHRGKKPPYIDFFLKLKNYKVIIDVLQSEQSARFFKKRNRNIIILVKDEIKVEEGFIWLTLGQIFSLIELDNIVNMDTRTVLSSLTFTSNFEDRPLNTTTDILHWLTSKKAQYDLSVKFTPVKKIEKWIIDDYRIYNEEKKFFSVIACSIKTETREVKNWTQPMIQPHGHGLIVMFIKKFNDSWHCLIQAKLEPGIYDIVEMAPTIQCITGTYEGLPKEKYPAYLNYFFSCDKKQIRHDSYQSEEGGRFFQESNRNVVIEVDSDFPDLKDNFKWVSFMQLKHFIRYNNYVNIQCRCLLTCMGTFVD